MAKRITQAEYYEQLNTDLVFELTTYIRENEAFAEQIPQGAQLIIQLRDDPGFNRWARMVAKANRDPGQPAMYVYIEKLLPSRIAEATLKAA
jgi:hypothetical protein